MVKQSIYQNPMPLQIQSQNFSAVLCVISGEKVNLQVQTFKKIENLRYFWCIIAKVGHYKEKVSG